MMSYRLASARTCFFSFSPQKKNSLFFFLHLVEEGAEEPEAVFLRLDYDDNEPPEVVERLAVAC